MDVATGAAGCGPAPVPYGFYLDGYGGALAAESFAEALPAAVHCVCDLTGRRERRGQATSLAVALPVVIVRGRVGKVLLLHIVDRDCNLMLVATAQ